MPGRWLYPTVESFLHRVVKLRTVDEINNAYQLIYKGGRVMSGFHPFAEGSKEYKQMQQIVFQRAEELGFRYRKQLKRFTLKYSYEK